MQSSFILFLLFASIFLIFPIIIIFPIAISALLFRNIASSRICIERPLHSYAARAAA